MSHVSRSLVWVDAMPCHSMRKTARFTYIRMRFAVGRSVSSLQMNISVASQRYLYDTSLINLCVYLYCRSTVTGPWQGRVSGVSDGQSQTVPATLLPGWAFPPV